MAIRYLNGFRLRNVVLAGAKKVIQNQQNLNKINVFPVADGDTGSNMASTFQSISAAAERHPNRHLGDMSAVLADAALNGSRGNSGAILTQFFQGLADAIGQRMRISIEQFADAVEKASQSAKAAILNPVEGTMITVMREWADWIKTHGRNYDCFDAMMQNSLQEAQTALNNTPKKLAVLERANVVDAGAQGFVYFLQGIAEQVSQKRKHYYAEVKGQLKKLKSRFDEKKAPLEDDLFIEPHESHDGDINYQYCTECLIHGEDLDLAHIRQELSIWGDSLVVVGNPRKVKIHIHTNDASRVFRNIANWGEILETKAEDMWAQHRRVIGAQVSRQMAIITDSSCCLPQEYMVKNNIISVPLQISINDKNYFDKINLSADRFYELLKDPNNHISTSQPSAIDFQRAFDSAAVHAKSALCLMLSAKLSGTYQGAVSALDRFNEIPIDVIDSKNLISGLGLIVMIAVEAINAGVPKTEILRRIEFAIARTKTFVSPQSLDYFIKGGRIPKSLGKFAKFFKILPIIGVENGKPKKLAATFGLNSNRRKLLKLAKVYASELMTPRFMIVHADAEAVALALAAKLKQQFNCEVPVLRASPMIAAHSGPGAVAISLLGFKATDPKF